MKKIIPVLLIAFLCLLSVACATTEPVAMDCGDFSITCLRGWKVLMPDEADEYSPVVQIYLPEKDGYTSNIIITMQHLRGLQAEDFTQAYAQNIVDASSESTGVPFTLDSLEYVVLGARKAVAIRYSGMKESHKVVVTEQLVPLEEKLYRFTYTRLNESDTSALEAVMASIVFK